MIISIQNNDHGHFFKKVDHGHFINLENGQDKMS